jgi:hypothetical protein
MSESSSASDDYEHSSDDEDCSSDGDDDSSDDDDDSSSDGGGYGVKILDETPRERLQNAAQSREPDVLRESVAALGGPGSRAVLKILRRGDHFLLRNVL